MAWSSRARSRRWNRPAVAIPIFSRRNNSPRYRRVALLLRVRAAFENGPQPITIRVPTARDARLYGLGQAGPLRRPRQKDARSLSGLARREKIHNRLPVWPEDFAVLRSIFSQYAAAERRDLEASHYMPIAVGPPHEAKIDLGSRGQRAHSFGRLVAQRMGPRRREPLPIIADQRDGQTGAHELGHKCNSLAIGTADEQHIGHPPIGGASRRAQQRLVIAER